MARFPSKIRGTSIMEFAFVAPVMVLIFVAMFEFSTLYYDKAIITNASREGARYGVVQSGTSYPTNTQITTYVQNYTTGNLLTFAATNPNVGVTATSSTTPAVQGSQLTVTVTYTYTDLVLHNFINHGQSYNLSATTVMTYE